MLLSVRTTGKAVPPARRRMRLALEVAPIVGVVGFAALAVAAVVGPTTAQLSASPGPIAAPVAALSAAATATRDLVGPQPFVTVVARPRTRAGERNVAPASFAAAAPPSTDRGRGNAFGVPVVGTSRRAVAKPPVVDVEPVLVATPAVVETPLIEAPLIEAPAVGAPVAVSEPVRGIDKRQPETPGIVTDPPAKPTGKKQPVATEPVPTLAAPSSPKPSTVSAPTATSTSTKPAKVDRRGKPSPKSEQRRGKTP